MIVLEHKVIQDDNEGGFIKKINAASKSGWVLSSQFQISMTTYTDDRGKNVVVKCFHVMLSKKVEEKALKAVKTDKNVN